LSNGDIEWDSDLGQYKIYLSQEDTYKMIVGQNPW
jgi:hypothetical protein